MRIIKEINNFCYIIFPFPFLLFFVKGPFDRGHRIDVSIKYHEADSGGSNREAEYRERYGVENRYGT